MTMFNINLIKLQADGSPSLLGYTDDTFTYDSDAQMMHTDKKITDDTQVVNKAYVDSAISAAIAQLKITD